jgi:hypothetical protein
MTPARSSAIVTVAMGAATERLDYTFLSFARKNPGLPLHAFILGKALPQRQFPEITYHLLPPIPDYSHPLREVYFRRMEVLDSLDIDYALTVDCFDVLCLQPLPPFERLLGNAHVAGCVEHLGGRYILGQGYTSNFLNGGVMLWDVPRSRDIRQEILARGKSHFRTVADDQHCLNEVVQSKYFDRLRILPCQYNFRAHLRRKQRGWPTVAHLDGVVVFHNAACIATAKELSVKSRAEVPSLPVDGRPLTPREVFWRRLRNRLKPWIVK